MALLAAARRRHRRVTGAGSDHATGDDGFMLIYVLMVTTIVTILVGSTLVVTSGSIIPSTRAAYDQAAYAAAQGGLQDFLAHAQAGPCISITDATCPVEDTGSGSLYSAAGYTAGYSWTAVKGTDHYRVTSTGTVTRGGITSSRTLVGDVAGGVSSNPLSYGYVTQFETAAPDVVQQQFPPRTIALSGAALSAAGLPVTGTAVTWAGAPAGANSAPAAGTVNACNAYYYGTSGRVHSQPPNAASPYVDWVESGSIGTASYTGFQPCQISFGHSTTLAASGDPAHAGGLLAKDALLVSNSFPGGSGPVFDQPVTTGYRYDPTTDGPCGVVGQDYRSFDLTCAGYPVDVGGTPGGAYQPRYAASLPSWPSPRPISNLTGCGYTGPTRVLLNADGSATITSPQTTTVVGNSPLGCYGGSAPTAAGLVAVRVDGIATVSSGVLYVRDNGSAPATPGPLHTSTGWNEVNTRAPVSPSNSVFYNAVPAPALSTGAPQYTASAADRGYAPAPGDNPSTKTDGSWTPQWTTLSSSNNCTTATPGTDLALFNCHATGSYSATAYGTVKSTVQAALAADPGSYATASTLQGYLHSVLAKGESADAGQSTPTNPDNSSRRWQVTTVQNLVPTGGCTPGTGSSTATNSVPAPNRDDKLFASSDGSVATTTQTTTSCLTATVTLQVGTCTLRNLAGGCIVRAWGDGLVAGATIRQFAMTTTVTRASTTVTSAATATSQFPADGDVTQYALGATTAGPGDLYVEGTAAGTLALVAQDDVVVTGTLRPATADVAVEVVGSANVRVYHPVRCTSTDAVAIAATTSGFCPDDLTGLYDGVLPDGSRPDQQYANLRPDLAGLRIDAAVFALGDPAGRCPRPASGDGVCGGQFTADNYNRGAALGTLTLTGTVVMAHHGPLGEEWQIPDATGQTSRPASGYQFTERYRYLVDILAAAPNVAGVVPTTTQSTAQWRLISVSTGPNP